MLAGSLFEGRYRVNPTSAMRRLRAVRVRTSWHSGGAGAPPGGTMTSCEELADTGGNSPGESAARRCKDAAMERRTARVLSPRTPAPEGADTKGCAARRSVPSFWGQGKGTTAPPRRSNNRLSLIHISEPTRQAEISYAVF